MQMFVGLMCWFAANVTRSPFFARFTASAMWPMPSRSATLEQRDAVGVREPLAAFDLVGDRDGATDR